MSELLDGTDLPWDIVSGRRDPAPPKARTGLPDPVVREPVRRPLDPVAAAASMSDAMLNVEVEISKLRTAIAAVGRPVAVHMLQQLESRRAWFRAVTEQLKEHR